MEHANDVVEQNKIELSMSCCICNTVSSQTNERHITGACCDVCLPYMRQNDRLI